jgi:hypothetical protein
LKYNQRIKMVKDIDLGTDIQPIEDSLFCPADGPEVEPKTPIPSITDIEWTNYVLGEFKPEELYEGMPKANGLRRLVRKLIGPILKSKAKIKQVPSIDNEQRSTAEYTVVVLNRYQLEENEEPYIIEFTDAADAWRGNLWAQSEEYAKFPVAMASTRAEVRALRKALNLGVVAAEEISDQPIEESGFSGRITESQISKIDIKCEQLDIDFMAFIGLGKYKRIEDVSSSTGISMFKLLNEYQGNRKPIPDKIKGYKKNWRDK